jgi:hypothetical protein
MHLPSGDQDMLGALSRFPMLEILYIVTSGSNDPIRVTANRKLTPWEKKELRPSETYTRKRGLMNWSTKILSFSKLVDAFKIYKLEHPEWKVPKIRVMRVAPEIDIDQDGGKYEIRGIEKIWVPSEPSEDKRIGMNKRIDYSNIGNLTYEEIKDFTKNLRAKKRKEYEKDQKRKREQQQERERKREENQEPKITVNGWYLEDLGNYDRESDDETEAIGPD